MDAGLLALGHRLGSLLLMAFLSVRDHPFVLLFIVMNAIMAYWMFGHLRPTFMNRAKARSSSSAAPTLSVAQSQLPYRDYKLDELLPYNGHDRPEILLAVDQRIYDVTSAAHHYGPGGGYAALAGRDASRSLATHRVPKLAKGRVQAWDDLHDLSEAERNALNDWVAFFDNKYPRVGTLVQVHAWAGSDNEEITPERPKGFLIDNLEITPP